MIDHWMIEFAHMLISMIQPVVTQVLKSPKENRTNQYSTYHDEEHAETKHHTHADIHSTTTPCSFLPVLRSTKNNLWNQSVHSEEHTQQRIFRYFSTNWRIHREPFYLLEKINSLSMYIDQEEFTHLYVHKRVFQTCDEENIAYCCSSRYGF